MQFIQWLNRHISIPIKLAPQATLITFFVTAGIATAATSDEHQAILDAGTIFNFDESYTIFNDQSAANEYATNNGNYGSNIGEQRLLAFKYALGILASNLRITQPIDIRFVDENFDGCDFFASATYNYSWQADDLPLSNTLYPVALAEQILQTNLNGTTADVAVTFNKLYFDGSCGDYYLGFEPLKVAGGSNRDFIKLVTHEVIHGLGFEKRPNNNSNPLIYERFLWAIDEQAIYATLSSNNRNSAARKSENVVFNGRLTRALRNNSFDGKVTLTPQNASLSIPAITSDIVNTPAITDDIVAQGVVFDLDNCSTSEDLSGKIAFFPDGCAREEFGYNGSRYGALIAAQSNGAVAAVTSGTLYQRRPAYIDVTIPVLSLPFDDYQTLANVVSNNPSVYFSIAKDTATPSGSDSFDRPIMFTGPDLADLSRLLHFSPRVHPKPLDGKTRRNLMEPLLTYEAIEPVERSIDEVLPSLIDLGWAAQTCGNETVDTYEECDEGDDNGGASCTQNCLLPGYCGDGVVDQLTEQCDDGSNNSDTAFDGCSSICQFN